MVGNQQKLKIKILTTEPFPIGLAASNRIGTYAQGLSELGCDVTVGVMRATELPSQIFNKKKCGSINNFMFKYYGDKIILSNNIFRRKLDILISNWDMCISMLKEKKKDKTDVIIYYSSSTSRALILFFITRIKRILFLKEESEFPFIYENSKSFFSKILFRKIHYNLFDGYLFMTRKIIEYFTLEKKIKKPFLHVPMTVEYERFQNIKKSPGSCSYIAYCGTLNNDKDGVNILIEAFTQIAHSYPQLHLYLIGDAISSDEERLYKKMVNESQLNERVKFTGRIGKEEIPELLCNAKILLLPRPESKQAEGGFPTKLGEYLSTGNPVITTSVGEIPYYLKDGENVFLATPGSVDSLSQKINEVFSDFSTSMAIAKKGQGVVLEHFNYKKQTKNIYSFIDELKIIKN
ncbi:MAG: glycosyltransferase [Ginsengibacter sp.]